jgi:rhamnosyl/mannosyltransferase
MKILHVYKDYYPVLGGIENHIKWQAEGMQARGHQVRVLVTNTGRRTVTESIRGVSVVKTGRQFNVSSAPVSFELPRYLRQLGRDSDIVHLHAPYPPGELAQLAVRAGQRTVITYHSDIVKQATLLKFYAPFLRRILRRADAIFVSNPTYAQGSRFLRPHLGKIEVIHFGIDLSRFALTDEVLCQAKQLRQRFGPAPIVLFVGRLRYYKGVEVLIRAMERVKSARCVVVGVGPMETQIRDLVRSLDLGERVCLAGNVSDDELPAYYHAADIFVLPSIHRSESLGIVQIEAMASGRPVISTELGTGTSYVNQHEQTGLVVPPEDPQALAQAIERLASDGALRASYGAAALARVQEEFSIDRMLERTEQLYEKVLTKST